MSRHAIPGGIGLMLTAGLATALASPAGAQTLSGRITDEDGRAVPTAIVRLLDREGAPLELVVADAEGAYVLAVPAPGEYHVSAERIGYEITRSPLLGMADPKGVYAVDVTMAKAPLGIEGVTVTADRLEKLIRGVRLEIGLDPRSLRERPILRPEIEDHVMRNHNVEDLIRWRSPPAIVVHKTRDGPCFEYRGRQCIEVYLNGFHITSELVNTVPLDGVETVVVLMPAETALYPTGAILLYTAGFIR